MNDGWSPYEEPERFAALVDVIPDLVRRDPERALQALGLDDNDFCSLFLRLPRSFQELWSTLQPDFREMWQQMIYKPIPPARKQAHRRAIGEAQREYGDSAEETLAVWAAIALVEQHDRLGGEWKDFGWWRTTYWSYVANEVMKALVPDYRERESGRVRSLPADVEFEDQGPATDAAALRADWEQQVRRLVEALTPRERQFFTLLAQYNDAEVARLLGVDVSNVYVQRRNILKKARKLGLER